VFKTIIPQIVSGYLSGETDSKEKKIKKFGIEFSSEALKRGI
jgi:hypothetical protein